MASRFQYNLPDSKYELKGEIVLNSQTFQYNLLNS